MLSKAERFLVDDLADRVEQLTAMVAALTEAVRSLAAPAVPVNVPPATDAEQFPEWLLEPGVLPPDLVGPITKLVNDAKKKKGER